ncbi:MAG: 7,8-didemethyl-8-hydroxy-5-deazariboflavin synthase subunit CofG, partial [bacterium]|nr:7,8-didemethyl-8-hydroxy-5-deazariboflavin synthase subunit CofG [bacterium]
MRTVTYSPNFTLATTTWCLDRCAYCSFRRDEPVLMSMEECVAAGQKAYDEGAVEALIMTGEGIDRHKRLRDQLKAWGYGSYAEYTAEICRRYLEIGLLPHTNIGTLEGWELELLKPYNVSMGVMVETTSERAHLLAHKAAPTKAPALRLATLEAAGRLAIPFTTGILIGIGEAPEERIEALAAIADLNRRYRHIQEVILQPLNPQAGTAMAGWPRPADAEVAALIPEMRRLMPGVHIQIPPNLIGDPTALLKAGADDIGGIAPEPDYINPDRPWPALDALEEALRKEDIALRPRMPIYDEYIAAGW